MFANTTYVYNVKCHHYICYWFLEVFAGCCSESNFSHSFRAATIIWMFQTVTQPLAAITSRSCLCFVCHLTQRRVVLYLSVSLLQLFAVPSFSFFLCLLPHALFLCLRLIYDAAPAILILLCMQQIIERDESYFVRLHDIVSTYFYVFVHCNLNSTYSRTTVRCFGSVRFSISSLNENRARSTAACWGRTDRADFTNVTINIIRLL